MKIKNFNELASQGNCRARRYVLEILNKALERLDAGEAIRNCLVFKDGVLRMGSRHWNLKQKRNVFVVGGGKAANAMARAMEEILGDSITGGIAVVKSLEPGDELRKIELSQGGHPVPNQEGHAASKRILQLVETACADDLFIGLISGGSSALMSCPAPGISLADEIALTEELLRCGARILEMNAVRRHISAMNGGRLAEAILNRGAEMVNLIISDSVGTRAVADPTNPIAFFGTPVAPDATTLADALRTIEKYNLRGKIPASIVDFLDQAGPKQETPKSFDSRICHFVLQRPANACEYALQAAQALGVNAMILTSMLEGESREAGIFLADVAKEAALSLRPLVPPCVFIAGGETTVEIQGQPGKGGPSQERALGFALEIAGKRGFCIGALGTDGTDGPTPYAGGIADDTTVERAKQQSLDVYKRLRANDSAAVLTALGDEIVTGNTGTNVCDLSAVYAEGRLI